MAKLFIERTRRFNWKGRKRDDLALEFFMGGAKAAEAVSPQLAQHLTNVIFLVAVRGYSEVLDLAKEPEPDPSSENWKRGHAEGYEGLPNGDGDFNYHDGWRTGSHERELEETARNV